MAVIVNMDEKVLEKIQAIQTEALIQAMEQALEDVISSGTMPYETGTLQDRSTYLDFKRIKEGVISLISDTPYAARLYFHPEYSFSQEINNDAGGAWFAAYISGEKKEFIGQLFAQLLMDGLKGGNSK